METILSYKDQRFTRNQNDWSFSPTKLFLAVLIIRLFGAFDAYLFFLDFKTLQIARLFLLGGLLVVVATKIRLNKSMIFVVFSLLILLNSIYQSNINFGQPYLKGFIGDHTRLFVFSGVYIYYLLYTSDAADE